MKKRAFKKYQDGGMTNLGAMSRNPPSETDIEEDEYKKKGLGISDKDPRVGFFERLRMGNIDNPKSEAYKRFGAGRGRAAAVPQSAPPNVSTPFTQGVNVTPQRAPPNVSTPFTQGVNVTPQPGLDVASKATSMPIGLQRAMEGAGEPSQNVPIKEKPVVTPRKKTTSTQTKKDVAKPAKKSVIDTLKEKKAILLRQDVKPTGKEPLLTRVGKAISGTMKNAGKSTVKTSAEKMKENIRRIEERRKKEKAEEIGYGIKKGGAVKKYASGGSVGKASNRADGIAMRGKTRGKIC